MSNDAIAINIAVLFVLIFVVGISTVPKKSDAPAIKTTKRIARHTFTATLVLVVAMAAFALLATRK